MKIHTGQTIRLPLRQKPVAPTEAPYRYHPTKLDTIALGIMYGGLALAWLVVLGGVV